MALWGFVQFAANRHIAQRPTAVIQTLLQAFDMNHESSGILVAG
jgi:hypothetical protein